MRHTSKFVDEKESNRSHPKHFGSEPLLQAVAKLVPNQRKKDCEPNNLVDILVANQQCDLQVYHQAFERWKH
jgi:hypothetical protein